MKENTQAKRRTLESLQHVFPYVPSLMDQVLNKHRGYIGIVEQKMETTIVYGGNIGIMENEMEATILGSCQNYGPFLGTLNIRCRIMIGIQKGPLF